MRTSTVKQKATVLSMVSRLSQDPRALVEIYLNYDCDTDATENIYERLMNIISKIGSAHSAVPPKGSDAASGAASNRTSSASVPTSFTTSALGGTAGAEASATPLAPGSAEIGLKRQGLECLVAVLRSLVAWGTTPGKGVMDSAAKTPGDSQLQSRGSLEVHHDEPESTGERTNGVSPYDQPRRGSTPSLAVADDPGRFESAKQRKTTLLEGIKKFNFKPKRVSLNEVLMCHSWLIVLHLCRVGNSILAWDRLH